MVIVRIVFPANISCVGVGTSSVSVYDVGDNTRSNKQLELRHGDAVKLFNMDRVSNGDFTEVRCVQN